MSYAIGFAGGASLVIGIASGAASLGAFKLARNFSQINNNTSNLSDANKVVAAVAHSLPVVVSLLAACALGLVSACFLGIGSTVIIAKFSNDAIGVLGGLGVGVASGCFVLHKAANFK